MTIFYVRRTTPIRELALSPQAVSLLKIAGIENAEEFCNADLKEILADPESDPGAAEEIRTLAMRFQAEDGEIRFLEPMDMREGDEDPDLLRQVAEKILESVCPPDAGLMSVFGCMHRYPKIEQLVSVTDLLDCRIEIRDEVSWQVYRLREMLIENLKMQVWETIARSDMHCTEKEITDQIPASVYMRKWICFFLKQLIMEELIREEEGCVFIPFPTVNAFALRQEEPARKVLLGILAGKSEVQIAQEEKMSGILVDFLIKESFMGKRFKEDAFLGLVGRYQVSEKMFYKLFPEEPDYVWAYLCFRTRGRAAQKGRIWEAEEDPNLSKWVRRRIWEMERKRRIF